MCRPTSHRRPRRHSRAGRLASGYSCRAISARSRNAAGAHHTRAWPRPNQVIGLLHARQDSVPDGVAATAKMRHKPADVPAKTLGRHAFVGATFLSRPDGVRILLPSVRTAQLLGMSYPATAFGRFDGIDVDGAVGSNPEVLLPDRPESLPTTGSVWGLVTTANAVTRFCLGRL
jgi:hypothetical protein